MERRRDVAWPRGGCAGPRRAHHGHGRPHPAEIRVLSDRRAREGHRSPEHQFRRRAALRHDRTHGSRGLEPARRALRRSSGVRELALRLARCARHPSRGKQIWVYPMVDRDPLPRWSHGPVSLLGDAAHPMYPIGSNGASQAILDARVLAGCLRHYATISRVACSDTRRSAARPRPRSSSRTASKVPRPPCSSSKTVRPKASRVWKTWSAAKSFARSPTSTRSSQDLPSPSSIPARRSSQPTA